jgi:hypothetical protein
MDVVEVGTGPGDTWEGVPWTHKGVRSPPDLGRRTDVLGSPALSFSP